MPMRLLLAATAAAALAGPAFAAGAPAPVRPPYGPAITLEQARTVVQAAAAEAKRHGWTMSLAVVEPNGELVQFEKQDGTQYGSTDVAILKARAAARFRRPTKEFADNVAGGNNGFLSVPGTIAIEGGVPIIVGGRLIGAIGASGATAPEDGVTAQAGAAALR